MAMRRAASRMSATRGDRHLREHFGFGNVGRDDARQADQRPAQGVDRFFVEQVIAALGDHHRIDDEVGQLERLDRGGHRLDDRRVGEHAGLDRVAAEVGDHRLDLRGDEIIGNDVHALDADGVLGGQRRDRRGAVDAVRGKGLQVGLDAGAAP